VIFTAVRRLAKEFMRTVRIAASLLRRPGTVGAGSEADGEARVDALHIDVMDGPLRSLLRARADVVQSVRKLTRLPIEVHLMIQQAGPLRARVFEAGADLLIVHLEAYHDPAGRLPWCRRWAAAARWRSTR